MVAVRDCGAPICERASTTRIGTGVHTIDIAIGRWRQRNQSLNSGAAGPNDHHHRATADRGPNVRPGRRIRTSKSDGHFRPLLWIFHECRPDGTQPQSNVSLSRTKSRIHAFGAQHECQLYCFATVDHVRSIARRQSDGVSRAKLSDLYRPELCSNCIPNTQSQFQFYAGIKRTGPQPHRTSTYLSTAKSPTCVSISAPGRHPSVWNSIR